MQYGCQYIREAAFLGLRYGFFFVGFLFITSCGFTSIKFKCSAESMSKEALAECQDTGHIFIIKEF